MSLFPAIAIFNYYLVGDNVLTEPIADTLALNQRSYIIGNYPELFIGHPRIKGVRSYAELPLNTNIIDLSNSIRAIEGSGDNKHVLPDKFLRMCREAGFNDRLRAPQLYLTSAEWSSVRSMKEWFDRPCVGIILSSSHKAKNWLYMVPAIKKMVRNDWNVFVFAENMSQLVRWSLPHGLHYVSGRKNIRELMKRIAVMDVLVGPDTGPMHIGGALGIPLAVICFNFFTDLYEHYPGAVFPSNNFTLRDGIRGVAILPVIKKIGELLEEEPKVNVAKSVGRKRKQPENHVVIRFRGYGDLLMTLIGIAKWRRSSGSRDDVKLTYITSIAGKKLLSCTNGLLDEIIGVEHNHPTSGLPLPPGGLDYSKYTTVCNWINRIDFSQDSGSVPRIELFARIMRVELEYDEDGQLTFSDDWKLTIPEGWKQSARNKLIELGIETSSKLLAFQVDCKGLSRAWPIVRCREFTGLAARRGWKVILLSDQRYEKFSKWAYNLTGQLSLEEYVGMIAICNIGLSADSALLHIAGCIDKKAVGLFGAIEPELRISHYDAVYPIIGSGSCVPCNDWQEANCQDRRRWPDCMWSIRPKHVLERLEEIIKYESVDNTSIRQLQSGRLTDPVWDSTHIESSL